MEFEFGKNLRRENNWETRTGGISIDLSISPSRREHFFAPTEGNIYTHVCFISNLITFCRDTFVYRIAEIYMANTVAPLTFEFSRGERERERFPIRVKLQIQHRLLVLSRRRKFLPDNFMPRSCITLTTFFPPPTSLYSAPTIFVRRTVL